MEGRAFDVVVVGSGPAGLSAALNARVRNKSVAVLSRRLGSQSLERAPAIENYLGVEKIPGRELITRFLDHARKTGANLIEEEVIGIYNLGDSFSLLTPSGDYSAKTLVLATGAVQAATIRGEADYLGMGVSYCATCDGPLYRGKRVVVIALAPHAEEEANFLVEICSEVTYVMLHRAGTEGAPKLKPEIRVTRSKVRAILGESTVTGVELEDGTIEADGVFIIRESIPVERLLDGLEMAEGVIRVDRDMATSVPGVFAAGDCVGRPYQVAKAVGEGQVAGLSAARFLDREGR
ncbi:MAG: NAD(P)/FAD-dependent oxidoreductase [Firmicutes bacterium]|jgi:thioredoxin reductase (NADPH)|nr:NAD(P)/FAD-dependent oxidoreductase [Bacillota bacterium]